MKFFEIPIQIVFISASKNRQNTKYQGISLVLTPTSCYLPLLFKFFGRKNAFHFFKYSKFLLSVNSHQIAHLPDKSAEVGRSMAYPGGG